MATLTTANSAFSLVIAGLYPAPMPMQGYAADDAFAVDEVEGAETYMGVDGILSGGWIPQIKTLEFSLQADSASCSIMDTWIATQDNAQELSLATATILVQGTGVLYQFDRGFLKSYTPMPAAKKILQPRKFKIEFNLFSMAPV